MQGPLSCVDPLVPQTTEIITNGGAKLDHIAHIAHVAHIKAYKKPISSVT